jgi:fluoride exporter
MPLRILLIFLGGGAGSVLRYLAGGWFQKLAPQSQFPLGTMLVNVIGCFLIGFISEILLTYSLHTNYRFALILGVLGGFTTFSAFGWETLNLAESRQFFLASLYVVLSVGVGLFAVWLGRKLVLAF